MAADYLDRSAVSSPAHMYSVVK